MPIENEPGKKPDLAAEYEPTTPAENLGVAVDPSASPAPEPAPTASPAPATPPRDPDTGRFVPQKHTHSAYLTRMAQDMGLSHDEIDSRDSDSLGMLVYHLQEHTRALHEQFRRETPPNTQPPYQPQQPAAAVPPPEEDLGLGEEFDPRLTSAMKKILAENQKLAGEVAQLKQNMGTMAQRDSARHQLTINQRIDAFFSTKDQQTFGTGNVHSLQRDGIEFRRRSAVVNDAKLIEGDAESGALEAKLERALKELFPSSAPPAPTPPEPGAKRYTQEEWDKGGVAPPTHRQGSEAKGPRKAIIELDKFLRERNAAVAAHGGEEEAGLPD